MEKNFDQKMAALMKRQPSTSSREAQRAPLGEKLSISEIDAIKRQVERCWLVPAAIGAKDVENMVVRIKCRRFEYTRAQPPTEASHMDPARRPLAPSSVAGMARLQTELASWTRIARDLAHCVNRVPSCDLCAGLCVSQTYLGRRESS